ncbi:UNVERIFIED_CONTAM: hypothetical protein Slati_2336700 [Sesamum latifolium]|uniref:Uncharacterized protein n=1 Tax=Sesamum latifolium TaxID=2727402 RepID=A0AAW2W9M0_9LAMI
MVAQFNILQVDTLEEVRSLRLWWIRTPTVAPPLAAVVSWDAAPPPPPPSMAVFLRN